MRVNDRVSTQNVKPWAHGANRPSVSQALINNRANGKTGKIIEEANVKGWWIVLHTDMGWAVYHESELLMPSIREVTAVPPTDAPEWARPASKWSKSK